MSSSVFTTTAIMMAISLQVLPGLPHRLITSPHPQQQWDSLIVSSDPITVRHKTHNATPPLDSNQITPPQKRSFDGCPQNDFLCLYGHHQPDKDISRILDSFLHQYSTPPDDHARSDDSQTPRNTYWTLVDSHTHNHPFDDKQGWITLDPVPWSTSKISKWHPNRVPTHHEDKPWDYAPTTQRPVQQFWVSGSSFHPERPITQWGVGTNDIITDNKPTGFPTGQYHGPNRGFSRPDSSPFPSDRFHTNYELKGGYPNRVHQAQQHPSTYPSNGNGEWVLLSTTKGYSPPPRNKWAAQKDLKTVERAFATRKIKAADISKYHEEELQEKLPPDNRKSDENAADDGSTEDHGKPPLQILYTVSSKDGEPTTTLRRKVRLQVLPSLVSSSTSHGGLLEVDSNLQTVDEAQQEEENVKKLKAIANVKKNKIPGYKLVPTSKLTGKGSSQTNVMTLAAVGAGMIPATMALLVPMALGRRKRSLPEVFGVRERVH